MINLSKLINLKEDHDFDQFFQIGYVKKSINISESVNYSLLVPM